MKEEEHQPLPGQRNIFDVIDDFRKVPKIAVKRKKKKVANKVPVAIPVEEFLRIREEVEGDGEKLWERTISFQTRECENR